MFYANIKLTSYFWVFITLLFYYYYFYNSCTIKYISS